MFFSTTSSATDSDCVSRKLSSESCLSGDSDVIMTDVTSSVTAADSCVTGDVETAAVPPASPSSSTASTTGLTNNNSLPKEVSMEELELLKKLEEQNRSVSFGLLCDYC